MPERGKYIVLEGGEFSGKSTQSDMLKEYIASTGLMDNFVYTREPGGTKVGEDLRKAIFFPNPTYFPSGELPDAVALQLFTANRAYNWRNQIEPALAMGMNVLSDRNWFSTLSYQGARGNVSEQEIIETTSASLPAEYMYPDLAIVLTIPSDVRRQRQSQVGHKDGALDAFEKQGDAFHDAVTDIYQKTVTVMGAVGIDGSLSVDEVHAQVLERFRQLIEPTD